MNSEEIKNIVAKQCAFFKSGRTQNISERIDYLKKFKKTIEENEEKLTAAIKTDLGKSPFESYMCEVGLTLSELSYQIKHIRRWTAKKNYKTDLANFHASSFSVRDPYGVVLIMSPWNYPFLLSIEPLVAAIAAGNCVILKPSVYSPATSSVMAELISMVFPSEYVTVIQGGREENQDLLEQRFDYIFFTGGTTVGRVVLQKAAAYLTPVTLELGGKSPCIIDKTANLKIAAARLAFGKYLNLGQTCVAPDYLLIDESVKDRFLELYIAEIEKMYGTDALENPDYGKIINEKHFNRIKGLIEADKVIYGGHLRENTLQISPTVMDHVEPDDKIMQEEIFGPVLPVISIRSIDEAFLFINGREKPLAAYLFTTDHECEKRFLSEVSFGGGCINDTIVHLATSQMGFGGVGNSGMGSYHGYKSFETFSHEKSILKKHRWIDLSIRYQPYKSWKEKLIRMFLH